MDASQYQIHSIGIAATNKALNSHEIEVMPIEVLPYLDGEINQNPTVQEAQGVDAAGVSYTTKVVSDNVVTATWIGSTHRRTPPDIRRGERVVLWKFGDTDKYYWSSMGRDDNVRKLETLIFTVSDTTDESKDSTDPANCYSLEVSTHRGNITLHTVKTNGEPYAYTFQFNTKDGRVVLTDDVGNYVGLDSAKTLIHLENKDKTMFELNKQDINFYAPKNLKGDVGNNATLTVGKNIDITAGTNISASAGTNVNIKAGSEAVVDGGAMAMLKSGGSFIKFTPAGGTIKAPKMEGGT